MKTTIRAAIGAVLALAAIGAGVSGAAAADTISPSSSFGGTVYLASADDETPITATTLAFNAQIVAQVVKGDANTSFIGPTGTTGAKSFIAEQGKEGDPRYWSASTVQLLVDGNSLEPNLTLSNQVLPGGSLASISGQASVKAAGGSYSVGIAFMKDNYVNVVPGGLFFVHVTIAPGGSYTFSTVCDGAGKGDCGGSTPTPTPSGAATQSLNADVTTPPVVDGLLSLSAPASTTSTIGNAKIVSGKSTATGTLGSFQVQDGRAASKPGWTLTTTSVGNFVNGSTTIDKKYLGLAPKNVGGVAATLGTAQVAGSATYPSLFAKQAAGTAGSTTLDADLTFVAPEGSPAGTYTSTLTVTLVSGS